MQIGMPSSTAPCHGGDLSNEAVAGVGGVGWARDPQKTQKGLRREPKPLVFPCCGGGFEPPSFGRPRCLSGRYLDIPLMCTEDGDTRAGSLISLLVRFYNQRGTAEQWIKEGGSHPLDLAILSSVPPPTRLVLPVAIQGWSLTGLQQRLFKTGGRLIRHGRYFILQLAESQLTQRLFALIIRRIERLAWHPT